MLPTEAVTTLSCVCTWFIQWMCNGDRCSSETVWSIEIKFSL